MSRFTLSASAGDQALTSLAAFHRWWAGHSAKRFSVSRVPFAELDGWYLDPDTGNLRHDSGKFFSIEGLRYRTDDDRDWTQPIINQPETGILGILVKEFNGVLHCLMQAKMEPGNLNTLQLSPTVQATRSNYTRVHRGTLTRYLEYFHGRRRGQVLVDVLQSEQGVWFWRKHNRNMVVLVTEDVPADKDFHWLPLDQVYALLRVDNLVNMDARTVLACMPVGPPVRVDPAAAGPFTRAVWNSYDPDAPALHSRAELLSWITDCKVACEWKVDKVPLNQVPDWTTTADEIAGGPDARFRVIGVAVGAPNREVTHWKQPLLEPREHGLAAFLAKPIDGVLHLLVQARAEPGLRDLVELAPTVQLPTVPGTPETVAFAAEATTADTTRIRVDSLLSEEGGRFQHALTRYRVVEVGDDFPPAIPESFRWMTVHQLSGLLEHGHYLNVEARTLVACVHSLR
ncbi:NDP-hexose 2,3-dehydratase family protein [Micromonospora endolithica]|uniref:NDP-hexose 2,3-dehydratase n=1 Tax=Micromonospora endolithica TaxID=230091 RepID=A0A3A9ZSV7_9ACTN|nr:NDP-hexose 2,3-dehydratase [Micromonospora endolithica]